MPEELKPCPFCGEDDPSVDNRHSDPDQERWTVVCDDGCGAEITALTPELAVAAWNRRVPPPDASPIVPLPATAPTRR